MAFATVQDVKDSISNDALKAITDDFDTDAVIDSIIESSIDKAEGYLKPIIPTNLFNEDFVKPVEIELSAYFLYMRLDFKDYAESRWKTVNGMLSNMLKSLKSGVNSSVSQPVSYYTRPREFTEDLISDW